MSTLYYFSYYMIMCKLTIYAISKFFCIYLMQRAYNSMSNSLMDVTFSSSFLYLIFHFYAQFYFIGDTISWWLSSLLEELPESFLRDHLFS